MDPASPGATAMPVSANRAVWLTCAEHERPGGAAPSCPAADRPAFPVPGRRGAPVDRRAVAGLSRRQVGARAAQPRSNRRGDRSSIRQRSDPSHPRPAPHMAFRAARGHQVDARPHRAEDPAGSRRAPPSARAGWQDDRSRRCSVREGIGRRPPPHAAGARSGSSGRPDLARGPAPPAPDHARRAGPADRERAPEGKGVHLCPARGTGAEVAKPRARRSSGRVGQAVLPEPRSRPARGLRVVVRPHDG